MVDIDDFIKWLSLHKAAANMRYDELKREEDLGYIKACEVIESELRGKIKEEEIDGVNG